MRRPKRKCEDPAFMRYEPDLRRFHPGPPPDPKEPNKEVRVDIIAYAEHTDVEVLKQHATIRVMS